MKTKFESKDKILADFLSLSEKYKQETVNFITYLKIKEEWEATKEILTDEDFLKSIMKGDEDFKRGRFKKWIDVKDNV